MPVGYLQQPQCRDYLKLQHAEVKLHLTERNHIEVRIIIYA